MKTSLWTSEELDYLRLAYERGDHCQAIASALDRTYGSIHTRAHILGLKSHKRLVIESVRHDYFRDITTETQAYILGLLAADGWSTPPRLGIGLHQKDAHLVVLVRDELSPRRKIRYWEGHNTAMAVIEITSVEMTTDLQTYGIGHKKHLTLPWPKGLSLNLQRFFLLGYFDGDGCAQMKKDRRRVTTTPVWIVVGNKKFLDDLRVFVEQECGIRLNNPYRSSRKSEHLFRAEVSGQRALTIDRWLHENSTLGLKRKQFS
jgi:hypothetical protein